MRAITLFYEDDIDVIFDHAIARFADCFALRRFRYFVITLIRQLSLFLRVFFFAFESSFRRCHILAAATPLDAITRVYAASAC